MTFRSGFLGHTRASSSDTGAMPQKIHPQILPKSLFFVGNPMVLPPATPRVIVFVTMLDISKLL